MRLGHDWEFGFNETVIVDYMRNEIVVRRLYDGSWIAYSRRCPHQGADLSHVKIENRVIRCPWHGLCFDLDSGTNVTNACESLQIFEISILRGEVFLSESRSRKSQTDTYLCSYGWDRRTGRFESSSELNLSMGDRCIGVTPRGVELVTILNESCTEAEVIITGRITGKYDSDDEDTEDIAFEIKTHLEDEFRRLQIDTEILNVEILLDNQAIVHYVGSEEELLGPISVSASHELEVPISFTRAEFNVS